MNKKVFTGLMAFVLLSGLATAQDEYYNNFNNTNNPFEGGDSYKVNISEITATPMPNQTDSYSILNYDSKTDAIWNLGDKEIMYMEFIFHIPEHQYVDNTTTGANMSLVNQRGSDILEFETEDNSGDLATQFLYYSNERTDKELLNADINRGGFNEYAFDEQTFYEVKMYFNNNNTFNFSITDVQGTTRENATRSVQFDNRNYVPYDSNILKEIRFNGSLGIDNVLIVHKSPDFSVSIPLPRVVDELGLPFGGLLVLNFFIGLLSLIVALIPAPVISGFEAFRTYVGGVITTAQTTLGLATEYMAWIQTVGVERLQQILGVLGIIALVRYGSVLKEGVDGDRSMIGAIEWIASDLLAKAESIERIIYRASDTLTNIVHLGFYLFEQVINVYKTIKNHIPLIG